MSHAANPADPDSTERWDKPRALHHPLEATESFRHALGAWFDEAGRDYPWRRTHDPYPVWVSEVMLQQTQIATVLKKNYFGRFLDAFPGVRQLAAAEDEPLLKAWEGLGYYRRARMMRSTAQALVERHDGRFPSELAKLLALPGIGRYTAGAIRAFAFGLPAVLLDGNAIRVLSRLLDVHQPVDQTRPLQQFWQWAELLADPTHPRRYHAGLMELGQRICKPNQPDCLACPVSAFCHTRQPEMLPIKTQKPAATPIEEHALWAVQADGSILLHQESGSRRTGLWKLPLRESADLTHLPKRGEFRYTITRYRVTVHVHDASAALKSLNLLPGDHWISQAEWSSLPVAAPFRRAIATLLDG